MTGILVTNGLTKRYGGLTANDAVAMTLAAGEVRGLIGPNGAGKTTFVNVITGIERPDSGEVALDGTAVTGLGPHRIAARGLVRSFQVARVFGNLTVRENLMVPYFASEQTSGTATGVARMVELLRLSTLEPLADAPAKSLSGGQRMLLQACAGFMIPGVKVHVLDEPFAGINPVVKDTLIELILQENRSGATFLIVSHEMDIIRRICPRVTVMIAGKVAAEGPLEEIARREDVVTAYLGRSLQ
ncbi:MAG TPA: ATP-binding cassette domain-containing protein [Xanthobacteraceae bacterium]|jgi:branched-chain amino acid transport system ATP-binding protein|nr:ATP-binding cassette domain-containing protein [Xanthobacteraceae bacterium]